MAKQEQETKKAVIVFKGADKPTILEDITSYHYDRDDQMFTFFTLNDGRMMIPKENVWSVIVIPD